MIFVFKEIFNGDGAKIDQLNKILCEKSGFPSCYDISTQTYTRKVDLRIANAICGLGATVSYDISGCIYDSSKKHLLTQIIQVQQITSDIRHLVRNSKRPSNLSLPDIMILTSDSSTGQLEGG